MSASVWHVAQFAVQVPPQAVPASAKNYPAGQTHDHSASVVATFVPVPLAPKVVASQDLQCF